MYFAMQTLNAYQSTPFHLNVQKLKHKFEGCISEERIKKLRKMELIFRLGSYKNKNECNCLQDILRMAVDENVCEILYTKGELKKQYDVQFFDITSAYGQWYATAYNFQTKKPQVFRCDKIHFVQPSDKYIAKPLSEFLISPKEMFRIMIPLTLRSVLLPKEWIFSIKSIIRQWSYIRKMGNII